jgi:glyceraldehyde-3-phosphate dehydrogenase/erythrose-4-phosphate dehydrogenase
MYQTLFMVLNHETVDVKNGQIFSAASCTTNAIMPIFNVIDKELGIHADILKQFTHILMIKTY